MVSAPELPEFPRAPCKKQKSCTAAAVPVLCGHCEDSEVGCPFYVIKDHVDAHNPPVMAHIADTLVTQTSERVPHLDAGVRNTKQARTGKSLLDCFPVRPAVQILMWETKQESTST